MKKVLYSEMNSLGSLVDSFMQNSAISRGLKKATIFKFWGQVVGKKFEKASEAVELAEKSGKIILTAACANAAVTSELIMFKSDILKKINDYSKPLGIEIDDIVFSHKIWKNPKQYAKTDENIQLENPYKEDLTGFNPKEITLSEEEISQIKENIMNNKALSQNQQERLLNSIIYDLKVSKFKNLKQ